MRHRVRSNIVPAILDLDPIAPATVIKTLVPRIANPWYLPRTNPAGDKIKRRAELELIKNADRLARARNQTVIEGNRDKSLRIL